MGVLMPAKITHSLHFLTAVCYNNQDCAFLLSSCNFFIMRTGKYCRKHAYTCSVNLHLAVCLFMVQLITEMVFLSVCLSVCLSLSLSPSLHMWALYLPFCMNLFHSYFYWKLSSTYTCTCSHAVDTCLPHIELHTCIYMYTIALWHGNACLWLHHPPFFSGWSSLTFNFRSFVLFPVLISITCN